MSVHIPLEVVDLNTVKGLVKERNEVIHNFAVRHIKHELMARAERLSALYSECPFGMRAVKVRVGIYHLGLYPDTEFHALCLNFLDKACKSVRELVSVLEPISETCAVVVALAKPAVVHNKHIKAGLLSLFCEVDKLCLVDIEVASLPGVEHYGVRLERYGGHNVVADELMEVARHLSDAVCGIGHYRLGRAEALACLERVRETIAAKSHKNSRSAELVNVDFVKEGARVYEVEAVYLAALVGRVMIAECDEGIVLMRRAATLRVDRLSSVMKRNSLEVDLVAVRAVKRDHIEIRAVDIEHQRHTLLDLYLLLADVLDNHISADDIKLCKNRIVKLKTASADGVNESDLKSLGILVCARRGKSVERESAAEGAVGLIYEIRNARAVRTQSERVGSEVTRAVERAFLCKNVGGFALVKICHIRRKGKHSHLCRGKLRRSLSVVCMTKIAIKDYLKGIGCVLRVDNEAFFVL